MWQTLYRDLAGHDFTILAVAFDEADAARPWIEAAAPTYPCLIDRSHQVAELYHMVNVPQAAWIDEAAASFARRRTPASPMPSVRWIASLDR